MTIWAWEGIQKDGYCTIRPKPESGEGAALWECSASPPPEFKDLAAEDELWAHDRGQEIFMYASSREELPQMVRSLIGISKVMIAFIWHERLVCVDTLDQTETFTQDHFISFVSPDLKRRRSCAGGNTRSDWPSTCRIRAGRSVPSAPERITATSIIIR